MRVGFAGARLKGHDSTWLPALPSLKKGAKKNKPSFGDGAPKDVPQTKLNSRIYIAKHGVHAQNKNGKLSRGNNTGTQIDSLLDEF